MLKNNSLNSQLNAALSLLGHGQSLVLADAGLPLNERIDLALRPGLPSFLEVLRVISEQIVIEKISLANEIKGRSDELLAQIELLLKKTQGRAVQIELISHEQLKERISGAKVAVRSGEASPWANAIIYAGVAF